MTSSWFGDLYDSLDNSRGLSVWDPVSYMDLIRKCQQSGRWRPIEIEGVDYLPYENVLPWESKFRQEYEALPQSGPVTLQGELLKEARSWELEESWANKADFVRACKACRRDTFAINRRRRNLQQVIDRIQGELRTSANYKTVEAFVVQNRKEVSADTIDLLRWASRGGRPLWGTGGVEVKYHMATASTTLYRRSTPEEKSYGNTALSVGVRMGHREEVHYEKLFPPTRKGLFRRIWGALFGA